MCGAVIEESMCSSLVDLPTPPSLEPDTFSFLMQTALGSLNEPAYTVYLAMNEYAQSEGRIAWNILPIYFT